MSCIYIYFIVFLLLVRRRGLRKFSNDAMFLVSKACAEKLRHIIIECITLVGHRQESYTVITIYYYILYTILLYTILLYTILLY